MTKKSYYANSVASALALAKRDHGEETLLLGASQSPEAYRELGAYEVVVAVEEQGGPEAAQIVSSASAPGQERAHWSRVARDLDEVRGELRRLSLSLGEPPAGGSVALRHPAASGWIEHLIEAGLSYELADGWIRGAEALMTGPGEEDCAWMEALARTIEGQVSFSGTKSLTAGHGKALAVAGPAGAGKTSLLAKLAFRCACERKASLAIVSVDNLRVAASETWRAYAAILDVPFELAGTPSAMEDALKRNAKKDLILIDTPGFGLDEADCATVWAGFWRAHPAIETHLVLNAQAGTADLMGAVQRWAPFQPSRLAFTRLDETANLGSVLAVAARTQLPMSFYSAGQQVPESLYEADAASILRRIGEGMRKAQAAAR
jgi:flagellar biosynthesis GTPase FlhF